MNYLILGINGMAGHVIGKYLLEQGHSVTGFARQKNKIFSIIEGDAINRQDILNALFSDSYDYVINCIGILNQSVDRELSTGIYLNSVLPHFIAEKLQGTKTKLIHISTDCVFEGTKGKYIETDIQDAHSYYGRSKALGEIKDNKNLTIRTSIIGPELKKDGVGLFHWFMTQSTEVSGYANVIWSGVTTLQLAKVIEQDAKKNITGLYHLVNNKFISKYELLQLFNQYCRTSPIQIHKNIDIISDKTLMNTAEKIEFIVPEYEQMIKELSVWIKEHSELYKQYEEM